jgi:hypothetical protein
MSKTSTPPKTGLDSGSDSFLRDLIGRITRLEIIIGAAIAVVVLSLVVIEPDILEAPFENARTLLFTFGGTALAAIAFVAMLRFRVPAVVRLVVLVVPFMIVNWWLISPYFVADVVDEGFSASISEQLGTADETPADPASSPSPEAEGEPPTGSAPPAADAPQSTEPVAGGEPVGEESSPLPGGPVLLGAGQFVGLAGHSGTGDAGIFQNPDGSLVLRFENFDIENGPDLEVYLVPGADQTSLPEGSIHLGPLKGNIGDQNYELPPGTELVPGAYTVLVWCEAFSVEFVGATILV